MAVAVAVASGLADVGLGVQSAAHALHLDFIAVGEEQYDLLFLRSFFESDGGANLLDVIGSVSFRQAVEALGGYDASHSGALIYRQ
jgi:putative molybdopterin biosynthesis protein